MKIVFGLEDGLTGINNRLHRDVSGALETSVIFQNGGNFQNRRRDATNVKMARNNSKQPRICLKMPIK